MLAQLLGEYKHHINNKTREVEIKEIVAQQVKGSITIATNMVVELILF
jgi:hypothetical protein